MVHKRGAETCESPYAKRQNQDKPQVLLRKSQVSFDVQSQVAIDPKKTVEQSNKTLKRVLIEERMENKANEQLSRVENQTNHSQTMTPRLLGAREDAFKNSKRGNPDNRSLVAKTSPSKPASKQIKQPTQKVHSNILAQTKASASRPSR